MARKTGQIVGRGRHRWLVRVFLGRGRETRRCRYHNRTVHGPVRQAQSHLNKVLRERDLGRRVEESRSRSTSSLIAGSIPPLKQNCATRVMRVTRACYGATSDLCSANKYCPQSPRSTCRTHTRKWSTAVCQLAPSATPIPFFALPSVRPSDGGFFCKIRRTAPSYRGFDDGRCRFSVQSNPGHSCRRLSRLTTGRFLQSVSLPACVHRNTSR